MPAISVIVPVYQAERLLPQCVESVLGQTFSDWELLLVDDGSRDGSPISQSTETEVRRTAGSSQKETLVEPRITDNGLAWLVHEVVLDEPLANELLRELALRLTLLKLLLVTVGIEVAANIIAIMCENTHSWK